MSANRARTTTVLALATFGALLALLAPCMAAEENETDLAKQTQNPVADLVSVPFQNNLNFNTGRRDDLQYILNIQPVIPFHISPEWNLITRTILPIIDQPELAPGVGGVTGLGDTVLSLFLSPAGPDGLIWGAGPVLQIPTGTDSALGQEKWAAGATAVVLRMQGPWVYGALANNVWSFAGESNRADVDQALVQPFLNYNLAKGLYLTSSPILTANWEANNDNTWTIPIGGGVGKIFRVGKLPLNGSMQTYYNVEKPRGAGDWQLRLQIQFLFPK